MTKRARDVPQGRLTRLAKMAALGARTGASLVLERDGEGAARHAAEVLGNLRGVAAKVGQMAGYVDGVVPDDHREAYERWMKGLLAAAPVSPPDKVRALVERELGDSIDRLFAEWTDDPIASASIGQVHRARLSDGREVAVKVQHPKIAEAVESDLSNAFVLESALSMLGTKKFESKRVLGEIRKRFREELDYGLEAERQERFAEIHRGDPSIRIPAVIRDRSSRAVLTSELVRGHGFERACGAPAADRLAWAEVMWRFVFKGTLVGGLFNADPHPGNYFFHDGGQVTFIDFGCVQPLPDARRKVAIRLHSAAIDRDERAFRDAARAMLELRGGQFEDRAQRYVRHAFEPLFRSPYRIEREFVVELVTRMKNIAIETRRSKDDRFVPMPEGMVFMNRLQFGFYSILARLDVEADFARVEREFLGEAGLLDRVA
jgi:predicted unusual protein kinase regulating ubiquinone biosynthesis (AarF/ABC1/UbiB family)